MTKSTSSGERLVSAASIDGLWLELPVKRAALAAYLRRFGPLKVEPGAHPDRARSWISLEVWTVTNGRLIVAGADQHESVARWAGIGAGVLGAAWGAGLAWMASLPSGNLSGAAMASRTGAEKGFELGKRFGGEQARSMSRAFTLGPYHELLIGVPNVSLDGSPSRYTAVIGMVTDDVTARSIDRVFGYGYHKQHGKFELGEGGSVRVDTAEASLSIEVQGAGRSSLGPKGPCTSLLNRRWGLPLLGGLHDGRWTESRLERSVDASGVATQIVGRVDVRGDLFDAPVSGCHDLGRSVTDGAHAVLFNGVPARITRPRTAPSNQARSQSGR